MSGVVPASISGTVGQDPTLRYLPNSETAMCDLRIASAERKWDASKNDWVDGPTMWTTVRCFRGLAEHVVESVKQGDRVVASGKWVYREWETDDGIRRSMHYVEAQDVGVSVLFRPIGASPGGEGSM